MTIVAIGTVVWIMNTLVMLTKVAGTALVVVVTMVGVLLDAFVVVTDVTMGAMAVIGTVIGIHDTLMFNLPTIVSLRTVAIARTIVGVVDAFAAATGSAWINNADFSSRTVGILLTG